jgi:hypothetical protein
MYVVYNIEKHDTAPDIIHVFHTFVERCSLRRLLGCARFAVACVACKVGATHMPLAIDMEVLPVCAQHCVTSHHLQLTIFSIYGVEFWLEITECAEHLSHVGVVSCVSLCFSKIWRMCQHATSSSEGFFRVYIERLSFGCFQNSDSCVSFTILQPDSPFQAFTYEIKNIFPSPHFSFKVPFASCCQIFRWCSPMYVLV